MLRRPENVSSAEETELVHHRTHLVSERLEQLPELLVVFLQVLLRDGLDLVPSGVPDGAELVFRTLVVEQLPEPERLPDDPGRLSRTAFASVDRLVPFRTFAMWRSFEARASE